jgi:UDP-N-acetylmuramoyl-L-alanyl-D-glutamate--2,6-diaminopimelate ligase
LRLFTEVLPVGGMSVLNADIPEYENLANAIAAAGRRVASYGVRGRDLQITRRSPSPAGQAVTLRMAGRSWDFALPLVGAFQLMNALCAVGLVIAGETDEMTPGSDLGRFVDALRRLTGVRGRLEHIATLQNGAAIYVDYAHKPDALDAILQALRPHAEGRLVVIFGCGGDRDPGKRPLMGDIAARLADHVIVTDDNPRSEDPAAIRAAILAASPGAVEIGEREEAIAAGVRMLQPGDVLVIAGKGHEQGQIVRDTVRPFDDAEVARRIVKDIGA